MLRDRLNRPIQDLRISVTDRCNFRCLYCMPLAEYDWIARAEILSYEEIERLARIFAGLGVSKIRLTGGEPLVRKDLADLIARLAPLPQIRDLCLTTNGALLEEQAGALRKAGLRRINVSLDTLRPDRFRAITQRGDLEPVLRGLSAAKQAGLGPIKINAVIERGVNDDEIIDLAEFSRREGFAMRFIEYMDVGNTNHWRSEKLVSKQEILAVIQKHYALAELGRDQDTAPAVDYRFSDGGGDIGVIASVTEPFCGSCTRARLTADGKLVTCLFSSTGHDLKALLRGGKTDAEVAAFVESIWTARQDRYSEERWEALNSQQGYRAEEHRKIEMISLGG
jgi:cyclic pyranopterin phosphate synthase